MQQFINMFEVFYLRLGKTTVSILIAFLMVLPAPAMAGGKYLDPVLDGNDEEFNNYVNNLPQSGEYEICIYADTEGIGHGFIKIRPPGGEFKGYGFGPNGWNPFYTDGIIVDDTDHVWNSKICYFVNKDTYVKALQTIREWRNKTYTLQQTNCVAFVNAVVNATGIPAPSGGLGIPRPGALDENIRLRNNSVKNTNTDKSKEMVKDSSGKWVPEPPENDSSQANQTALSKNSLCSPDDLQETINQQVGAIPAEIKSMIENKQVLLTIEYDQAQQQVAGRRSDTLGIVFQGTQVTKIDQTVDNPDIMVYAKVRTISDIFMTKDPMVTYRMGLARGDIRIVHSSTAQNILISGAGLLNKVGALISPSQYLIKTGEQRDIEIGRKPYVLSRPGNIILLQDKTQPYATVINSDGAPQGYTTPGTAQVIKISSKGHSPNSGVYMNPIPAIQRLALNRFSIPYGNLVARQASQATQYTMQGRASNAKLILGGVGFAYGYGR